LEIASRNDVLENNNVVLSPRLISAARIQPKNELIVEMVVEEDEDEDEDDEDEEEDEDEDQDDDDDEEEPKQHYGLYRNT
jgi:TATA-binding protein-associated factor Taf7